MTKRFPLTRPLVLCLAVAGLSACTDGFDWDLRSHGNGFDTSGAVRAAMAKRPRPDNRGIISYPGYQVVVAREGDTVMSIASRIGINPGELARYNGISPNVALRGGEVLALPTRVAEPSAATGAYAAGGGAAGVSGQQVGNQVGGSGQINITALANNAIDRSQGENPPSARSTQPVIQSGQQPLRHKVRPGETAYSIARLYNVPVKSLADWNGLDANLDVRVGQILLIPVPKRNATSAGASAAAGSAIATTAVSPPGQLTPVPQPPSASRPLPAGSPPAAAGPGPKVPPSPDLGKDRTKASSAKFDMPVQGKIIRGYVKGKSDGIDISAPAGTAVHAADSGTVAAITKDVDRVPVMVVRHADNLLTVYANIDRIKVKKGEKIRRGQTIAVVRKGSPSFVHFEVRKGFSSVDPMPYLQ
ncbi:peptidase M23B [Defluviimonas sp. 20V17]|uniref:Murein DD-endopeptidase MepM and murein hydrolase activator NlpD, contain LysM domain n=1 Tax=Allgaiera indica TaxID=765699 RepID=A0AAN5A0Q1_9RHOB|nr:LysM peptidoglycan-binding domain-containing protein [Allgaiera indica]KDB02315.1 peptidase M23B [Defluviimonas sp. 20V17]GHE02756.1 peptidase M23 [Allgaiera indica]SDX18188.1 Murein DD-endopeptidase MepM and murein hydrolase activator NlpD, contain LysM domain [Allgaiera indica]